MGLGNINNFFDALQQGEQHNQEMQMRRQQMQAAQQQAAGAEAVGRSIGGAPTPAPPPSGPMAAIAALLGHRQQPQAPAPQAPAPQQQQAPQGGAMPPIALSPQTMAAMPPAAQQGLARVNADSGQAPPAQVQDPSLSGTAQNNGGGQPMGAFDESLQNIKAISSSITASNPGISGATLMAAVAQQIELIKGVAPSTKATMTAQIQVMQLHQKQQQQQYEHDDRVTKIEAFLKEGNVKAANALILQGMKDDTAERDTDANVSGRESVASTGAGSREEVARIGGKFKLQGIDKTTAAAKDRASASVAQKDRAAGLGFLGKVNAAQVGMNKPMTGQVPGAGGGAAPVRVTSPQEFAKLPKGAHFLDPKGNERVKS